MVAQNQKVSLFEAETRKPWLNFPKTIEATEIPDRLFRESCDDFKHLYEEVYKQVAAMQAQNQDLKAYAHMVAHDLKDPLAVLIVTSDLLVEIPNLPRQELKEYLGQIRSTAYEMDTIIHNLLLFSEVDKTEVRLESVDMKKVVTAVLVRMKYLIKDFYAQVEAPAVWPDALGYAPWIEEVWANYISNAIKHGGRPPVIELGYSPMRDGTVRFWARDNGPGVLPEVGAHLFKAYGSTGEKRQSGHGLGLSIVASIIDKLGGQVGVESEPGNGSTFFFTLPGCPPSSK